MYRLISIKGNVFFSWGAKSGVIFINIFENRHAMIEKSKLEEIAHEFDLEFYKKSSKKIANFMRKCMDLDDSFIEGTDKIKKIQEEDPNSVFIYTANHKSHLDYLFIGYKFFESGLRPHRYAAGKNMFIGPLKKYWKKLGAFSVDKGSKRSTEDLHSLFEYVEGLVATKNDILLFPEGGRSYEGHLEKLKTGLLSAIMSSQEKNQSINVYIVPVTVTYDRVIEDLAFPRLIKLKERIAGKIKEKRGHVFDTIQYYLEDITRIFIGKRFEPNGKGYINIGDPFSLKEAVDDNLTSKGSKTKVCDKISESFNSNYPILPSALVCKVLRSEEILSRHELEAKVSYQVAKLKDKGHNLSYLPLSPKDLVDSALKVLGNRGVHVLSEKNGYVMIKNKKVADYYSNTISFVK